MKIKAVIAVGIVLILSGCGQSITKKDTVSAVKSSMLERYKSASIGDAVAGFSECLTINWKDESKENQKIATLTCSVKSDILLDEYNKKLKTYNEQKAEYELEYSNKKAKYEKDLQEVKRAAKDNYDSQKYNYIYTIIEWIEFHKNKKDIVDESDIIEMQSRFCSNSGCNQKEIAKFLKNTYKIEEFSTVEGEIQKNLDFLNSLLLKGFSYDDYPMPTFKEPVDFIINPAVEIKSRDYVLSFSLGEDGYVRVIDSFIVEDGVKKSVKEKVILDKIYGRS